LLFVAALACSAILPVTSRAQRSRASSDEPEGRPTFSEFRGVRIGMSTDEARKKLGSPRDKSDVQDFYVFNDTQAVEIFYDKNHAVSAISIDFMDGASNVPSAKDVLGTEADAKADGSQYKMMRYPKAGYWVSYSRTAGSTPTTTVTIQKIEH
jgi:outer membrane protein assembly factor BamE (lipoprotein component of BamABCDE complex)